MNEELLQDLISSGNFAMFIRDSALKPSVFWGFYLIGANNFSQDIPLDDADEWEVRRELTKLGIPFVVFHQGAGHSYFGNLYVYEKSIDAIETKLPLDYINNVYSLHPELFPTKEEKLKNIFDENILWEEIKNKAIVIPVGKINDKPYLLKFLTKSNAVYIAMDNYKICRMCQEEGKCFYQISLNNNTYRINKCSSFMKTESGIEVCANTVGFEDYIIDFILQA